MAALDNNLLLKNSAQDLTALHRLPSCEAGDSSALVGCKTYTSCHHYPSTYILSFFSIAICNQKPPKFRPDISQWSNVYHWTHGARVLPRAQSRASLGTAETRKSQWPVSPDTTAFHRGHGDVCSVNCRLTQDVIFWYGETPGWVGSILGELLIWVCPTWWKTIMRAYIYIYIHIHIYTYIYIVI